MSEKKTYSIFSLGDSALIIDFGNLINKKLNESVISLFYQLQKNPLPGMIEAVPAYSSLTVYYNAVTVGQKTKKDETVFEFMSRAFEKFYHDQGITSTFTGSIVTIPVCYEKEFGKDLDWIAAQNKIAVEEIISLHTTKTYRVYMLGFLPGFAYMGEVDKKISSPRKLQPVPVEAGSVGIAGKQTGVYPFKSPGGWQIIGRTPLSLFDKNKNHPTLLKAGDQVKFISISKDEFENHKSRSA